MITLLRSQKKNLIQIQLKNKHLLIAIGVLLVTSIAFNVYFVNRGPQIHTVIDTTFHEKKLKEKDSILNSLQVKFDSLQSTRVPSDSIVYRYYEKKNNTTSIVRILDLDQRDSTWANIYGSGW